jgi:hypothetical protein
MNLTPIKGLVLNIRKGRLIGNSLIVLAVILMIFGLLMPYYKTPQRLSATGPDIEFTSTRSYWITTYIIPPIDKGTPINLSILSDKTGATWILLAPYDSQTQNLGGPPVINVVFAKDQKGFVTFTSAERSGPYMLMITSYNSSYTFSLSSVWSPFYELRALTTMGLAILPIGIVATYYDGIVERREEMVREALKGIPKDTSRQP